MIASVDRLFTGPAQHDPLGVQRRPWVSESDGADMGQVLALLSDVLTGLREFQQQVDGQFADVGRKFADVDRQFASIRQEFADLRQDAGDQIASLRQEVTTYHGSVVGHGTLITEMDARLGRIERHLGLAA